MNYVIFDVEYNSAFNHGKIRTKNNEECPFEIIEIGAVKMNEDLKIIDTFRMYVKPHIYNMINPRVMKKIKITMDDLEYGFRFNDVYKHFRKWCGEDILICSWSNNDIIEMIRNCWYNGFEFRITEKYLDIQFMYMKINELNSQPSLKSVLEKHNISIENRLHHALVDANYTAEVFKIIFDKDIIDELIVNTENIKFKNIRYVTNFRSFNIDKRKLTVRCPKCNKFAKRNVGWQKGNDRNLYVIGDCNICNSKIYTKAKIKIINNRDYEYTLNHEIISNKKYKSILWNTKNYNK